eukprot:4709981-Prymnesium_polylepis.2
MERLVSRALPITRRQLLQAELLDALHACGEHARPLALQAVRGARSPVVLCDVCGRHTSVSPGLISGATLHNTSLLWRVRRRAIRCDDELCMRGVLAECCSP